MILNVSGRTDIVAFYSSWFWKRYQSGYVDVRNPFHPKLVSRIYFEDVDAILFCTKNPLPLLQYIEQIQKPVLIHVTLTPYQKEIELGVISKPKIIEAIHKLSKIVGKDRIFVRYDPIFLSPKYTVAYHKKAFARMCQLLHGAVNTIIISFLDEYKNVQRNRSILKYRSFTEKDFEEIGLSFSQSAKENGMTVQTCFEQRTLIEYGFVKGECLSAKLAFELTGKLYKNWTARKGNNCNCVQMVDIGVYNSCSHFCKYCYANYDERQVRSHISQHHPDSSLLIGELEADDVIKIRRK